MLLHRLRAASPSQTMARHSLILALFQEVQRVTGTPRIRGRIKAVLNGLVGSCVITGFRTNLYSRTP